MITEDEFGALFICPKFDEKYLSPWYRQGYGRPEFFRLLQETNPDSIKKFCISVNDILKTKSRST